MQNYFDFFGLPLHPVVDEKKLRKKFLANSKKFHPDFHTDEDDITQEKILEQSTLNNEAYKTLSDSDLRLKHLLDVTNTLGGEGQNTVPQSFLMEMMDINEGLMELEMDASEELLQSTKNKITEFEDELTTNVSSILQADPNKELEQNTLQQLGEFYLKRRYLLRIRKNLSKFAAH